MFTVHNGNLTGAQMADLILKWMPDILETCIGQVGPYIDSIQAHGLNRRYPKP
jgi:hypothetical protein